MPRPATTPLLNSIATFLPSPQVNQQDVMKFDPLFFALFAVITAAFFAQPVASARDDAPQIPIAMNLTGITDYSPGFPFKNLPTEGATPSQRCY